MNHNPCSRGRWALLAAGLALLASCQSSKPKSEEPAADASAADEASAEAQGIPYDARVWDKGPPEALGAFLAELDKSMRAWTNLTLTAQTSSDKQKASKLQLDLMRRVHAREQDLVDTLESGPPRNRAIAAGALGFAASREVQGPLIVALGDKYTDVVQNAALSLALLEQPDTPLLPLLEVMQNNVAGQARSNAAYAVRTILQAGAPPSEDAVKAARAGLLDMEPFAQAQSALLIAILKDGESVPGVVELLSSPEPLVVRAAIQSLLALGRAEPRQMGPTARGLVQGLELAPANLRPEVLRALVTLSGHNYGQNEKEWAEWAQRLP